VVSCSTGQVNVEWPSFQPIVTSNGVGTGDFTVIAYANPAATGTDTEHILVQKNDAGGSPFAQMLLGSQATSTNGYANGSFAFYTFNGSAVGIAASGVCDGNYHVWMGVRQGASHTLYKDGVAIASGSFTALNILQGSPARYLALGSRGNGSTQSYPRQIAMAAGFNRALSAMEILSISRSPWQLFLAPTGDFTFPSSAVIINPNQCLTSFNQISRVRW
jgi:Concanavalin A-like lectin/glucanases superfamily